MLKILHLNNYISYTSGVTRFLYHLIKNTKDTINHEILCFGGDALELFQKENIKVTVLREGNLFTLPNIYLFLLSYCKKNKFNILHNHHRIFDTITAMLPGKSFKTITSVHSKVFGLRFLSYKSDKLISVSDSITNHLTRYYRKPADKIRRMKNFIDISDIKIEIERSELKKQLALGDDDVILYVGRFSKEKGVDILIKAFKDLYSLSNKVSLIMIGEGKEGVSLKKFCSENKLHVQFQNPVTNVFNYYNIADVVVLPSRVDPFPYVMLEAGLMNKPFIGSNVDGIPELIKHRVNGLLFRNENASELVKLIRLLLEDKALAEQISLNLYNEVIENYSAEKVVPEYLAFYNSLS